MTAAYLARALVTRYGPEDAAERAGVRYLKWAHGNNALPRHRRRPTLEIFWRQVMTLCVKFAPKRFPVRPTPVETAK